MKIKTRIEAVACDDSTRFVIQNPYFDGNNLVATNGIAMAVIPSDELEVEEGETPGTVPVAAIKEARKGKKSLQNSVFCNGGAKVAHNEAMFQREVLQFPNYQKLCVATLPEADFRVRINASLLSDLSKAIQAGNDGVELHLKTTDPLAPIKVTPYGRNSDSKAFGILMPLR